MEQDNGGPAFPFAVYVGGSSGIVTNEECDMGGLTIRDYFAAKALQALVHEQHTAEMITVMAMTAYDYADAMLEARK